MNGDFSISEASLITCSQTIQLLSEMILKPYPDLKEVVNDITVLSRNYGTDKIINKLMEYYENGVDPQELREVIEKKKASLNFASKIIEFQFADPFVISLLKNWHAIAITNLQKAWDYFINEFEIDTQC